MRFLITAIALATALPAAAQTESNPLTTSNRFNPAISVNGLFLGRYTDPASAGAPDEEAEAEGEEASAGTGMGIQEVEIQFLSNVDAYFQANLIAAMEAGDGIEIEEGYLQPFWQPGGLSFRAGKLKAIFGRENGLHTHALPLVERNLAGSSLFGDEGLGEFGVETSWLAPTPWYLTLTGQVLAGDNDFWASERGDDFVYLGSLRSLFDLNDDTTFEIGGFGAGGNDAFGTVASAAGGYAFLKWRPARRATTRGLALTVEWLYGNRRDPDPEAARPSINVGGGYGLLQARLARRWHVAGRFDYLGEPLEEAGIARRGSALVAYAPTEFSAIRLQGSRTFPPFGEDPVDDLLLQFNFTIGAHPAHAY